MTSRPHRLRDGRVAIVAAAAWSVFGALVHVAVALSVWAGYRFIDEAGQLARLSPTSVNVLEET